MTVEQTLLPSLQSAIQELRAAEAFFRKSVSIAQRRCKHKRVAEMPWMDAGLPAHRICLSCGYEEVGSHWSGGSIWSKPDHTKPKLGNDKGRDVMLIDRDEFYRLRLPFPYAEIN